MTLIELLFNYRDVLREHGREAANQFLTEACQSSLHEDIIDSVDEMGNFIQADGRALYPSVYR
jgi:hypothetical protein